MCCVEEQHGLLVNRYEDIFSFSHLTIQEFLTAKHIVDNQLNISLIVKQHLTDKRWREVFLLLAGLRKADELLVVMDQEVKKYMDTLKLQRLLTWVDEVTDSRSGNMKAVGKRAYAIAYAYANAYAVAYANTNANTNANAYAYTNACAIANVNTNTNTAKAYANAYAIANAYAYANTYKYANSYNNEAIDCFIQYAKLAIESEVYQGLDLAFSISQPESMKSQIPDNKEPSEVHQNFARRLTNIFLESFKLTPIMVTLSEEEIKAFDNYLYGVRLLIECEHAAVRRTPEVWSKIEERLLITAVTTN
jgi:hypothetical protein